MIPNRIKLPGPAVMMMEIAINRALELDDFSYQKMIALKGHIIGIELLGLNLSFYLAPNQDGVQVLSETDEEVDTWIRGTPISMMRLGISDDRSALFKGDVTIDGDMELGRKFQRILDGLEIDWEEPLSKVVGDVAAHQLGDIVRGFSSWALNSLESFSHTTGEYFQEESQDIVSSVEVERFVDKIDELKSDTERLSLRLEKILSLVKEK